MGLDGKRVLVIGGGSGIGYAVAEMARQAGAGVVIASSNHARLEAAAQRLGDGVAAQRLDVTDEPGVEAFFKEQGAFDHVVTTAGDWVASGGGFRTPLAEVDLKAAADSFRVRFWGALTVAKHAARVLPPGGTFTLTGGMVAHRPTKGACVATSVGGAIEHLTRGLAVELAPIRVNAVVPGLIRTGIWDRIPADRREQQFTQLTAKLLVPRIGEPDEAARAYLYLMECGYVTGQILYVEGGSR
ncbi:MAG TPA: SDR family oxidoreductase [Polyangiales bacterium]|nr:SDR family oxidoreductase [Polyangiales bacterium]